MVSKLRLMAAATLGLLIASGCGGSGNSEESAEACEQFTQTVNSTGVVQLTTSFANNWQDLEGSLEGAEAAWRLGDAMAEVSAAAETASQIVSGTGSERFEAVSQSFSAAGEYIYLKGGSVDGRVGSLLEQSAEDFQSLSDYCDSL